jgi:DNA-binding MarR family transcriptional regulator
MRTNSPHRAPERRLIFLLNVAQRRLQRYLAGQTQKGGVSAAQSGLLFVLGQRDGMSMGDAGTALDLGMPGMSGLVERTVEAGLIEKRADPDDGRAWRLWLTPSGRRALTRAKSGVAELNARLMNGFSETEIDVVARWLRHVQAEFPKGDEE